MKLSIITINLNSAIGLRKTIESVISQTFSDYEFIIIDGASTDGSVEVIKEFAAEFAYWISEPDKGIYNAMNKGILHANGVYCLFLNSGDYLVNTQVLQEIFKHEFCEDIIYGNVIDGNTLQTISYPEKYTLYSFLITTIPHNASLIKRNLFYKYGLYNELYKIASDWEFWIKTVILHNCQYRKLNLTISFLSPGGISSDMTPKNHYRNEGQFILESLIPNAILEDYTLFVEERKLNYYALFSWIKSNKLLLKILKLLFLLNRKITNN
jgi:glycosyltransferase involved in cell wall biosynthesis